MQAVSALPDNGRVLSNRSTLPLFSSFRHQLASRQNNASSSVIYSDSTWKTISANAPSHFEQPNYDDSTWVSAFVIGPYSTTPPWNGAVSVNKTNDISSILLFNSSWIWTDEMKQNEVPPETRPFRKTIATPAGKKAISADISITADNTFQLFVNGALIGSPPNETDVWHNAQIFSNVTLVPSSNVVAVLATNFPDGTTGGPGSAGLLAAISITYVDIPIPTSLPPTTTDTFITPTSSFPMSSSDSTSSHVNISGVIGGSIGALLLLILSLFYLRRRKRQRGMSQISLSSDGPMIEDERELISTPLQSLPSTPQTQHSTRQTTSDRRPSLTETSLWPTFELTQYSSPFEDTAAVPAESVGRDLSLRNEFGVPREVTQPTSELTRYSSRFGELADQSLQRESEVSREAARPTYELLQDSKLAKYSSQFGDTATIPAESVSQNLHKESGVSREVGRPTYELMQRSKLAHYSSRLGDTATTESVGQSLLNKAGVLREAARPTYELLQDSKLAQYASRLRDTSTIPIESVGQNLHKEFGVKVTRPTYEPMQDSKPAQYSSRPRETISAESVGQDLQKEVAHTVLLEEMRRVVREEVAQAMITAGQSINASDDAPPYYQLKP